MPEEPLPVPARTTARWRREERFALLVVLVLFISFLVPAVREARREARDDARIRDLSEIKTDIEQYYNAHESFPMTGALPSQRCVTSEGGSENPLWGANSSREESPRPVERKKRWFPYTYCPTKIEGEGEKLRVVGFYLQGALEHRRREEAGFDPEEGRNYRFRVFQDGSWTFYRICGGNDFSCGEHPAASPSP